MTPRTPENSWSLITVIGVPPRDPNDDEDEDEEEEEDNEREDDDEQPPVVREPDE